MVRHRHGVTLIETLVVLGIIAVLLALLLPAIYYAREAARSATCANNLRQLTIALEQDGSVRKKVPPRPENTVGGWAIDLLPFLEETRQADALSGNPPLDPDNPPQAARRRPSVMICPSGFDGDSEVKTVPVAHYGFSRHGLADLPVSLRAPWVLSPWSRTGLQSGKGPHWGGGYNVVTRTGPQTFAVRFINND